MRAQREWMARELAARGIAESPEVISNLAEQWRAYRPRVDKSDQIRNDEDSERIDDILFAGPKGTTPRKPLRVSGDRLEAAASHISGDGGVSASATGKTRIVSWAKSEGLLIDRFPFRLDGPKDIGAGEHHVFEFAKAKRWIKLTKGSGERVGITLDTRGQRWSIGRGEVAQYLQSLVERNNLTGDDTRLHAVYQDKHGNVGLVISQPDIQGDQVDSTWISHAMQSAGFDDLGDSAFYRGNDNTLWVDLNETNAVRGPADSLLIYDGTVIRPTIDQLAFIGLRSQADRATFDTVTPEQARAELGRAQPDEALVLTPTGWYQIGALLVGDQILDEQGNPQTVAANPHRLLTTDSRSSAAVPAIERICISASPSNFPSRRSI